MSAREHVLLRASLRLTPRAPWISRTRMYSVRSPTDYPRQAAARTALAAPATPPRSAAPRSRSDTHPCACQPARVSAHIPSPGPICSTRIVRACGVVHAGKHRAAPDGAIGRRPVLATRAHRRSWSRVVAAAIVSIRRSAGSERAGAHSRCSLVQLPSHAGSALIFVARTYLRRAKYRCQVRQRVRVHIFAYSRIWALA